MMEEGSQPATFYELLGGTEQVKALVDRFYDIMD
ncbi:MAG TPA: hemoglobin-like protein, partial [Methylophilaceae bacterium]|nr:hemoglobin-like protein [Methylophilaceae bacterium]